MRIRVTGGSLRHGDWPCPLLTPRDARHREAYILVEGTENQPMNSRSFKNTYFCVPTASLARLGALTHKDLPYFSACLFFTVYIVRISAALHRAPGLDFSPSRFKKSLVYCYILLGSSLSCSDHPASHPHTWTQGGHPPA